MPEPRKRRTRGIWRLLRPRSVRLAAVLLGAILVVAIAGPKLAPFGENEMIRGKSLQPPSREHPLGTDNFGRDVLSRIIYGTRVSLTVAVIATSLAAIVGTAWGLVSAYQGGWFDEISSRILEVMLAFPYIVLAMALVVMVGAGTRNVVLVIALIQVPEFARIVRSASLSVKRSEFVEAATALGGRAGRIMLRHILPNVLTAAIVLGSMAIALAINIEAALSFLGLGVTPPHASWGTILADGRSYIWQAPWISTFAGLAITVTVLAFNLLGDSLRDHLDPKGRTR